MNTSSNKRFKEAVTASSQQASQVVASIPNKRPANITGNKRQSPVKKGNVSSHNLQMQSATNLPVINAPTSLTNLAQLSGIALLPINNTKPSAKASSQKKRQKLDNSSTSSTLEQANSVQKPAPSSSHNVPSSRVNKNQKSTFNISSIQSLQLINQTANISGDANQHWVYNCSNSNSLESSPNNTYSTLTQPKTMPKTRNMKMNNRGSKSKNDAVSNTRLNQIQVIPVPEDLPLYANVVSETHSAHQGYGDNILNQPNSDQVEEQCLNIDGDVNNISLIKLMAILNNPALTITAVSNPPNNNNASCSIGPSTLSSSQSKMSSMNNNQRHHTGISSSLNSYIQTNNDGSYDFPEYREYMEVDDLSTIQGTQVANSSLDSRLNEKNTNRKSNATNPRATNSMAIVSLNATLEERESDLQLDWLSNYACNSSLNNGSSTASLTWPNGFSGNISDVKKDLLPPNEVNNPIMLSTSVRNLMMQQMPVDSDDSTVSVQLLKHIANQTKDNEWNTNQSQTQNQLQKSVLEPECILSVSRDVPQLDLGAKYIKKEEFVTSELSMKKKLRRPLETSKNRLFIARSQEPNLKKKDTLHDCELSNIDINVVSEREVYLSDQYSMLDGIVSNDDRGERKNHMPEPDEIFINRSKRVMSRIDTMMEKMKRRRFEIITGGSTPKVTSPENCTRLEEEYAEVSDEEWLGDENKDLEFTNVIRTQLPLEEAETVEKRDHLMSVGLVSRRQKNKILLEQCEEKSKIFSPVSLKNDFKVTPDLQRFVDTMLKTGGIDVQMRIDCNIKRNDLPLLEGLNRNTSRMKMSYMNNLGLEKRSKRTTLYKVKQSENLNTVPSKSSNDLSKSKSHMFDRKKISESNVQKQVLPLENFIAASTKIKYTSCREVMDLPDKDEYMKSLGLMAS